MSVLLIAGSIAAPVFAADSEPVYAMPGVESLSALVKDPHATMVATDSLSGQSLKLYGPKSGTVAQATKYYGYDELQDWSDYKFVNVLVKNNNGATNTKFYFATHHEVGLKEFSMSKTFSVKSITASAVSGWQLLSVDISSITAKPIGGFAIVQIYGNALLDAMWLSVEAPKGIQLVSTSIPDGYDDVNADSASVTFTYDAELAPAEKQRGVFSLTDSSANTVEVDVQCSGSKLTIAPKSRLEYGESYSLSVSGVKNTLGVEAKSTTLSFKTADAAGSVVSATPVITTSDGTAQASVTVSNFKDVSASATLVLACYDGNGKMIKSKTDIKPISLDIGETDKPITAEVTGYSGETIYAFVIDSIEERNLLSSAYASLPAKEPDAFPIGSYTAATAFASGSCNFANDVVTFDDAKLNGGMKRTLLMSILYGDEVTHMSLLHNDADGNVNVSYPMINEVDKSGDYVIELKGWKLDGALTGNYTYLSDAGKQEVYDDATSLTGSSDALKLLKDNSKAFQLDDSTLENDTLMLMTAESLYYNKSTYTDFNDVVSFSKEAVQVCSELNSQTWDTLADYVINNEDILINTNIEDFKALSSSNRNKVCYSITPLTFESLSDLNKKLADATDDYLESLKEEKPSKRPSSGGGGGGYSVSAPAVVVPPVVETPVPVAPVAPVTPAPEAFAFDDLAGYDWAQESINSLFAKGVISKSDNAKYRPADRITRAEFVKLVVSALYDASEAADGEFADVSKDEWCYSYIAIAAKRGLVNGREDGTFGKNDYITRQEMAAVIHRALLDLNINLASGLSEYSYGDDAAIADYAKDAVYALYHTGIMKGMADDSFAPAENANRAQAACVIDRIMKGADHE